MDEYEVLTDFPENGDFATWERKKVSSFGKWFMAEKGKRMQMLFYEVHRDPEFADWKPDFSPESLKPLSDWFEKNIKTTLMPEQDYQQLITQYKGIWLYRPYQYLSTNGWSRLGEGLKHFL